jgi:hypothetical protein
MKTFIRKYQIIIFFALTFIISWFPWYTGRAAEMLIIGPSLAAFIIVFTIEGKKGLIDLLRQFGRWRARLGLWGIAIFGAAVLFFAGLGVHLLLGGESPPFTMIKEELNLIPLYLVLVVLLPFNGPVGEEFGWRGYALPRMQTKYGPLIASLVIGTIWGVWHMPDFFAEQGAISALAASMGMGFVIPYTLGTIANSVYMTWLYNKSKASALIAGIVWHAGIDFWAPIILSEGSLVAAREGTSLPTISLSLYLAVIAVLVFGAIVLTVATKGKLGFAEKDNMETQQT